MIQDIGDWQRTHYSKQITPEMDEQQVIVMGWVRAIRKIGKVIFIQLADCYGFVQVTAKPEQIRGPEAGTPSVVGVAEEPTEQVPDVMAEIAELGREYVIAVRGTVEANKEAPRGVEIIPMDIRILNTSEAPLPLEIVTKKTPAELPTRLDQRVLDLRRPEIQAIFKIQAALTNGMEEYLIKEGFLRVFTPCLMGMPSESGSEMFVVPYFGKEAYLRQDPQLHRQLLIGSGFDRIFDTGPSWRAEKSHTIRHLCEHRGCAVELGFIKDEIDTMRIEEQLIVAGIKSVNKNCKEELEILGKKINVPKTPFPELRFPEIYNILKEYGTKIPIGADLDFDAEKLLARHVQEKYRSDFFFINRFPFACKPFYVMRVDEEPEWARSVDLEAKGGIELSSGGQREHRYDQLLKNIKEKKIDAKKLEWFTHFFKYGFPSHGGFNIGIERLTMVILDLPNIREAVLFSRDPERLVP